MSNTKSPHPFWKKASVCHLYTQVKIVSTDVENKKCQYVYNITCKFLTLTVVIKDYRYGVPAFDATEARI